MTGRGRSRGKKEQDASQGQPRTGQGRGDPAEQPFGPSATLAPVMSNLSVSAPPFIAAPAASITTTSFASTSAPLDQSAPRGSEASRGRGRPSSQSQPQQHGVPPPLAQQESLPGTSRGGNGNGGTSDRGAVRGKHTMVDIIRTKPENVQSKRGTSGQEVTLKTNYFRLLKKPTWQLYQYRVDFSPNIELRGLRNRLIYEQKPIFGGYLFDGSMLFLSEKLPNDVNDFISSDRDGNAITTIVKFVGQVSMATAASVQVLNLILRRSMEALKLQLVGRNFFDAIAKIDIPQFQLQLWPGYLTSIRQHESDVLLCAEVTNKVMRTETLYDILQQNVQNERNFQQTYQNSVLGMTVLTGYNNKTYRITDVDFDKSPNSTFSTKDGDVTYVEYYKKKYDITIRDPNQPLLVSKASERDMRAGLSEIISLVPELCRATGLTDKMVSDFRLMTAVATYTRLAPKPRIEKLNAFNKRLQGTPESIENLQEWNFSLDKDLVEVKGRLLAGEKIFFGNNRQIVANPDADWSRDFRNVSMFKSNMLHNWAIIVPPRKAREAREFVSILQKAAIGMRYEVGQPHEEQLPDDRVQSYSIAIDQVCNKNPQLIMCIVPNNSADRYGIIKKKCCVERAIPTQVMITKTITPKPGKDISSLMTVGTKVVIQINSKLGGAPWMVDIPMSGLMVVGFDVCHDTKDKQKSYGALVATMDMKNSQNYFSAVSAHTNGEELSNQFALNMNKALINFKAENGKLPARILIYRDGVGEGQTNYVFEHEIKNLRAMLSVTYQGAEFKLAFIIVSKRINTRFFRGDVNPGPGTVVDDVVTLPERYDFFLVSQSVKQGTVSPTNYNVLFDNIGLSPDKLQLFTYKMTHLYYNWTGTLRVPAVCQYAHKLAFLVGTHIHQPSSTSLEKQLYFL